MFEIDTIKGHDRMSTQDLLLAIEAAVRSGETEFNIHASGQHDIGGPLWNADGKKLVFHVTNAGQRVGSMCLPNTEIFVEDSTSADVGWLNAGGMITVRGDAGDTAGHCSAGGKIFIGGRAGTRSGSLMKHDPLYEEPELWILKNTGSFSFEFMGGGRAVVCGYDCDEFASVLGERACVGMVGGVVYVRGPISSYPSDIRYLDLEQEDIDFLAGGMDEFLEKIQRTELKAELSDWSQWKKLRPLTFEEKTAQPSGKVSMKDFRANEWVKGGIFSDVAMDDFAVHNTISNGLYRLRVPSWDNAKYNAPCEFSCPTGIPTQKRYNLIRQGKLQEAIDLELEYTPFPGSVCGSVCPNPCMDGCTRGGIDEPIQIGNLGWLSAYQKVAPPAAETGKKIGIIGGGMAGLSAAWQLRRKGHTVTVYDDAEHIGGKLEQVIPRGRLMHDVLVMCAFMVFFRAFFEVNSSFIAAVLTIVGYSINNTIIVFDRIRENAKKPGWTEKPRRDIVEISVGNTLSRTINTSLTTLITLVALYAFGVESIREFAFPLIVGMLAGTYSSVLLSGQVWAMWMEKRLARKAAKAE